MRRITVISLWVLVVAAMLFKGSKALAQEAPAKEVTKIGYLSCNVASGWGFIIGSSRKLRCVYTPADNTKKVEQYDGSISKFGADIGYVQSGVIFVDGSRAGDENHPSSRSARRPLRRSDRGRDHRTRRGRKYFGWWF